MPIIRVKKDKNNPYVIVNKEYLENPKLSFKAKGLMTYLLSKPDDWSVYVEQLKKSSKDSKDSVNTAIKELMNEKYVIRIARKKVKGQFGGYDYTVYEKPQRINRHGSTATDKPFTENPPLLYNDLTKDPPTNKKEHENVCDSTNLKGTIKNWCGKMKSRYCPDENYKQCMEWFNEYRKWLDVYMIEKKIIKMTELVKFKKSNKYFPILENQMKNWMEHDNGMPAKIKVFRETITSLEVKNV